MGAAPCARCEWVTHETFGQGRHLGSPSEGVSLSCSMFRYSLIAQAHAQDECLPVDGPIDGSVQLDESLRLCVCVLLPLRPGCGHEPLALALGRSWQPSHRVCAWLWLPIR